ncbi:MAG: recA [Armatimonadetes bacterium]|nr:recA [Armatimonadota bacterium]
MDKLKALDFAVGSIEKKFGKGSIMRLGSRENLATEVIPTGSLALDIALGVGGLPKGRIIEVYGQESSGKTTLAYHVIAEAQRRGGLAAFIDAEHAVDPIYARNLGVDIDNLLISQPDTGEEALEIMDALARSNALDVIVLDSVAALVPKAEMEGEMGDSHMGIQARLMSQALRKLGGVVSNANTVCIFINQIREKIGVMFGNPETTPGGRALKFWSSVRLEVRKIDTVKQGSDAVGTRVRVKIVKNKVAPPFKQAEFDVMFGRGISKSGGILDLGVEGSFITKTGTWFTYNETRLGQGRENAKNFLEENPAIMAEVEARVRAAAAEEMATMFGGAGAMVGAAPAAASEG